MLKIDSSYFVVNEKSEKPIILLCEHAGKEIPWQYQNMGFSKSLLEKEKNLPFDYGVNNIVKHVAKELSVTALLGRYSRLLIDLNRAADDPTLIAKQAHNYLIPGNQDISNEEKEKRKKLYYEPFHKAVEEQIKRHNKIGQRPLLFTIHAFDPIVGLAQSSNPTAASPDIGLLFTRENLAVTKMRHKLVKERKFVQDNFPYDLNVVPPGSIHIHSQKDDLPIMAVEISIAKIQKKEDERAWSNLFVNALKDFVKPASVRQRSMTNVFDYK